MTVERNENEVIIRVSVGMDIHDLRDFLDYIRYKELTSTFQVNQKIVDDLASDINSNWWKKNKGRFLK